MASRHLVLLWFKPIMGYWMILRNVTSIRWMTFRLGHVDNKCDPLCQSFYPCCLLSVLKLQTFQLTVIEMTQDQYLEKIQIVHVHVFQFIAILSRFYFDKLFVLPSVVIRISKSTPYSSRGCIKVWDWSSF